MQILNSLVLVYATRNSSGWDEGNIEKKI